MGWAADFYFGSALILAKKQSSFIRKWIESYSSYNPMLWGDNSVIMATKLSVKYPKLIHVERHYCSFYPDPKYLYNQNYKWSHSFSLHIYKQGSMQHVSALNFLSIRKLNTTLGAVFRYILFGNKELCLWITTYVIRIFLLLRLEKKVLRIVKEKILYYMIVIDVFSSPELKALVGFVCRWSVRLSVCPSILTFSSYTLKPLDQSHICSNEGLRPFLRWDNNETTEFENFLLKYH